MPSFQETDRLKQLLAESWAAYDRLHDQPFVVRPAIPILFFGDCDRYFASKLRVITVGLNPSRVEFPEDNRFARFPAALTPLMESGQREHSRHLEAQAAYFRTNPYKQWFASFEPILTGLGSSYYDIAANSALHTDLCSPIATAPTWSKLPKHHRLLLQADGMRIWHSLVEALSPDIILVSIAEKHLDQVQFRALSPWQVIWTLSRKQPYQVSGRLLTVQSSKPTLLVFGRAAQKPFGTITSAMKTEVGTSIKEWYIAHAK